MTVATLHMHMHAVLEIRSAHRVSYSIHMFLYVTLGTIRQATVKL